MTQRPRFVPDEPLPPYSYVSGQFPHPVTDPAGHSFGLVPPTCPAPDPSRWRDCREYLVGLDLFNHGYYWEAHEAWERVWHACGRTGPAGNLMKGLIKLAAAGVKAREGRPAGVRRHAQRAIELFQHVRDKLPAGEVHYFGLSLPQLLDFAAGTVHSPPKSNAPYGTPVEIVFPFVLEPGEGA